MLSVCGKVFRAVAKGLESEPDFVADVAFGSKGEILAASRCFPLCPQQPTSLNRVGMSVRCLPTADLGDH
jgi:hypothetical protein